MSRTRVTLIAGVDLLPQDSQYAEDEYARWLGWGHSSTTHAAAFARAAGLRQLATFHYEELHDQVAAILQRDREPPLITSEGLGRIFGADSRATQNPKDVDDRA